MSNAAKFDFTSDELVLSLVSLVRTVDPALLRHGPEGLTLDLGPLSSKSSLGADEALLLKLCEVFDTDAAQSSYAISLSTEEARRLRDSIARLECLREWSADVQRMSCNLRARLNSVS